MQGTHTLTHKAILHICASWSSGRKIQCNTVKQAACLFEMDEEVMNLQEWIVLTTIENV